MFCFVPRKYFTLLILLGNITRCGGYSRKVLFVSMDGFRWDYLDMVETPNFDRMAAGGVKAPKGLVNTFVTKSLPCHYTMATGLYEESHGLVGNNMYDPVLNESFTYTTTASRWFDGGEPIWITARLQGRKSATYFWTGSTSELRGTRPNIWMPYVEVIPFKIRVESVVDWMKEFDIDIATLYFHEPDRTGHSFGPNSPETMEKVKYMDTIAGYILDKIEEAKLTDFVNIIITSDHGMAEIDTENRVIDLLDYVEGDLFDVVDSGAYASIRPIPGKTQEVYNRLKGKHPQMTVYLKQDIPDRYHYKNHRRVMDIFALPDEGWIITKNKLQLASRRGSHGYDNMYPSMHPIFLAKGPNFKKNYKVGPFETVNLYPLICELLEIDPAPNNGSFDNVKDIVIGSRSSGSCPIKTQIPFTLLVAALLQTLKY